MKFKQVAVVALVALAGAHAGATTIDLGSISGTVPIGNTVLGFFTDVFNFDVTVPSIAAATAVNTSYTITPPGITLSNIHGFSAMLDGTPLTLSSIATPVGPGIDQIMQTLLISSLEIAVGSHSLVISGVADPNSAYDGFITVDAVVVAVPEPESYTLVLAALGIGFLARRSATRRA